MGRYQSAVDLWDHATRAALDAGTLRLQPGQWIKTGDGALSRFYSHNPATGHVVAFHGPAGAATRKLREFVAAHREAIKRKVAAAIRRDEIPPHVRPRWKGDKLVNRNSPYPLWSGKGPVPTIGCEVRTAGNISHIVVVTGYELCDCWLMVRGYRVSDAKTGNLAGAEILYEKE